MWSESGHFSLGLKKIIGFDAEGEIESNHSIGL